MMVSEKKRKWRRINGLSWPLDPLQLVAWIFTLLFALVYFGVLIPSLPPGICQLVFIYLMVTFLGIHCVLHVTCNVVDPADPEVRSKKQTQPLPDFSRNKHLRVIENQYCHICKVKVCPTSKHCSACNKCVQGFDHHCKWLNNCVGTRNYRLFVACISTALASSLILIILCIVCSLRITTVIPWLCTHHPIENLVSNSNSTAHFSSNSSVNASEYIAFVPVSKQIWLSIIIITLLLAIVAFALLAHLLGFHLYLISKDYSTYGYILRQREANDESSSSSCCKSNKCNRKCSLSQSNKKISPQVPNTLERNKSALQMYKLNEVNQAKKDNFSVSKEGLCSSGDVYIGSPAKCNDSTITSKTSQAHQNDGYVADPKLKQHQAVTAQHHNSHTVIEIAPQETPPQQMNEFNAQDKEALKSRSPSLNNLMMDDSKIEVFDNIENCQEIYDNHVISCEPNEHEIKQKYLIDNGKNNNYKSNQYVVQNGRSFSLDQHDIDKVCDDPHKRRCSVEIHNLTSGNANTSLTPVDADTFISEKSSAVNIKDHRQSNSSIIKPIRNTIV